MALERKELRHAVVAALGAATIVAPGSLYSHRVRPVAETSLPALSVYSGDDTPDKRSRMPRTYRITHKLQVLIMAQALDDVADVLDDLAEKVLEVMGFWRVIRPGLEKLDWKSLSTEIEDEGDQEIAYMTLTFEAVWVEEAPGSDATGLNPLNTVHADLDLPDQGDDIDASQTITIDQN